MKPDHTSTRPLLRSLQRIIPPWLGITPNVILGILCMWGVGLALAASPGSRFMGAVHPLEPVFLGSLILPWPLFVLGNYVRASLSIRRGGLYSGWFATAWLWVTLCGLLWTYGWAFVLFWLLAAWLLVCLSGWLIHYEH